jgi:hypothetical protein
MIHRELQIGSWAVDFLFVEESYDEEEILSFLYDHEAPYDLMMEARDLMELGDNTGFTYTNHEFHYALVVTGPATSGAEFIDSFVHEMFHLAIEVAHGDGANLRGEVPAYIAGDAARDLADMVCYFGCVPGYSMPLMTY